ncbi:MAG: lipid-A-disaccharide synthase [Cyclobacteriaceae bacterium]
MKYYLIVGEKSGDLHASNLMKSIQHEDPEADFRYFGGNAMQAVGGKLVRHHDSMAFMGFLEVIKNLGKILGFLKECKKDILSYQPDVIIAVDYSGFNLKMEKWAHKQNIKHFYYIAPKVWKKKKKRVVKIKKYVDRMFCIFPFEVDFFAKHNYPVDYVGNPSVDAVHNHQVNKGFITDNKLSPEPIIAILPGSRRQEIERMLEFMLEIYPDFDGYQFVVGAVPNYPKSYFEEIKEKYNVAVVYDQTFDLLAHAHCAVVTSGTATLETALFNVPQVVAYKTSWVSYQIAKYVLVSNNNKYISLVNIIADKEVVRELIWRHELTRENLSLELRKVIDGEKRQPILDGYKKVSTLLGHSGTSDRAARKMIRYLNPDYISENS